MTAASPDTTDTTPDAGARLLAALAPPEVAAYFDNEVLDDGQAELVLEAWEIADLDAASWAARHRARRLERCAAIKALADEQRFRLAEWEKRETSALEADLAFFDGRLRAFHERALITDKRALTIKLPDGTELRSQAGKLAVEVDDLEAFSRWAEQHELAEVLLRMADPEANKAEIAKRLASKAEQEKDPGEYPAIIADTGEVAPGVRIVRKARTFTISTERKS